MKKSLRFMALAVALLLPFVATSQTHTLTVADGSESNAHLPIYGFYVDVLQRTQIVYPSSLIAAATDSVSMAGGSISALTFYLSSVPATLWGCPFTVRLMEVPGNGSISGFANTATLGTTVYTGTVSILNQQLTITFTTPYVYGGGNLLVELYNTTTTTWSNAEFYGVTTDYNAAWQSSSGSTEGEGYTFIPKTTFSFSGGSTVSCHAVHNLRISAVTAGSLSLAWSDSYNLAATYSVYNLLDSSLVASGISDTTYTVTGLDANTRYAFFVVADCGNGDLSFQTSVAGRTACVDYSLPYTTGFENDFPNGWPSCWEILSGGTFVHENTNNAYHGDQFLHFEGSYHSIAVMPAFSEPLNGKQVRFWTRPENGGWSYCGSFQVGYITDLSDTSSFVPLDTYSYSEWVDFPYEYFEKIVEFNNVPAGARVAFCHNALNPIYFWFLDDVVVEEQPSCSRPSNFQVVAVTDSSISFSWTDTVNSGTTYTLYSYYDTVALATAISDTSYTLTGLAANTLYSIALAADCPGGGSSLWRVVDVRTDCGDVAIPYVEGFEGMNLGEHPLCWEHLSHGTSSSNVCSINPYYVYNGSAALHFCYSAATGNVVALPEFGVATNLLRLRFMHRSESSSSNSGNLQVGYLTNAASAASFVPLATLDRTTDYSRAIVSFASAPDSARMAFRHVASGTDYYWKVDDLYVEYIPACGDIEWVAVDSIGTSSAALVWNNTGAAAYRVEARQGSSVAAAVTVSDTMVTVTGLAFGNDYDFYVRSICGTDSSLWSQPLTAHIGYCLPAFSSVDNQGIVNVAFGIGDSVNNSQRPTAAPYYGDYSALVGAVPAGSVADIAITYNTGFSYGTVVWVDWNHDLLFTDDEIVFSGNSNGSSYSVLHATFLIDPFQDTGTYYMRIAGSDYTFDDYVLNGGSAPNPCLTNGTWGVVHDYSLRVSEPLPCTAVSSVTVSDITSSGATLAWDHTGIATFSILHDTTVIASGITDHSYTLTNLNPATYYTFSVVANCVVGGDGDAVEASFATLCNGFLTLPFNDGFGSTSATRACWELFSHSDVNGPGTTDGMGFANYLGRDVLRFASINHDEGGDYEQVAWSPAFTAPEGTRALRMEINYATYTYEDNLFFGYLTPDGVVWDSRAYYTESHSDFVSYVRYLPPTATQILVRYLGSDEYWAFVDSVSVTAADVFFVTLATADADRGSVTPEGLSYIPQGGSITATATAVEGFHFAGWYNGTTLVSATNPYAFIPTADITLTAAFEPDIVSYTVTVNYDHDYGTVDGSGTFEEGSTITLTATPATDYEFAGWVDESSNILDDNPLVFTLTADRTLTALFRPVNAIVSADATALSLHPNPATASVTVDGIPQAAHLTLLNLNGQPCGSWTPTEASTTLDISTLAPGPYFLRITTPSTTLVRKLIVR